MNKKFFKTVNSNLRNEYWRAGCSYIKYYDKKPLDEKAIFLESQHGKEFNGIIYHTVKHLLSDPDYKDFKLYLSAYGKANQDKYTKALEKLGADGRVKVVTVATADYYLVAATAKYLINDNTFLPFFIKKKGQVYLNTWHGTPLKTLGKSIINDAGNIGNTMRNFLFADYLLYPNEYTRDHMVQDYMLENLARSTKTILCGYPRNTAFFDEERKQQIKDELFEQNGFSYRRSYAYMPTYRGTARNVGSSRSEVEMLRSLYLLDDMLEDDEILYVNLHPIAKKNLNFKNFKHIKPFPAEYETYEFLNTCDVLVTDYSSVFFDFACSKKKIVLFPYDKEEYLAERGTYMTFDELPFPQVFTPEDLLAEMRDETIPYDDTEFLKRFCSLDSPDATKRLLDQVILKKNCGLPVGTIKDNGKENVIVYGGNLDRNGVTSSLRSLLNTIDCTKRNYYLSFSQAKAANHFDQLATFNSGINFFPYADYINLTATEKSKKIMCSKGVLPASTMMKSLKKRYRQNFLRAYGGARIDAMIQFNGYEELMLLQYSVFKGRKAVFVHSDMLKEISLRKNQNKSVLKYAYSTYDKVAVVTDVLRRSTASLSGREDNIVTVRNTIPADDIREKSKLEVEFDSTTKCSVPKWVFDEALASDSKKFINIGRFSPEKGHDRLVEEFAKLHAEYPNTKLFIVGGNSRDGGFDNLSEKIKSMGLEKDVILVLSISNPYPILGACDYFVMSSFYEGFGLVLAEADILGLPVISTNISGPRAFMQRYGGELVENTSEGIYDGMKRMLLGEIKPMNVDFDQYNKECVEEFEALFN